MSLGEGVGPALRLPGEEPPVFLDFAYLALVIGMTSQTADVGLASTHMRRLVMVYGVIAFVFHTTLLALAINVSVGLLGTEAPCNHPALNRGQSASAGPGWVRR